jgi:VWFA-related protein
MVVARFVFAALLVAAVAVGQERTTHVDLVVTDAKGNPIRGLTAADFEVVHAGKAGAVATVTEVADPAPRRILILLDNMSLPHMYRRQITTALKSWIETNLRPVDHVSIGATNPGLRQALDWTTDKTAILAALDTVTRDAANHGEQERRRAERMMQDVIERAREIDALDRKPYIPSFEEVIKAGRSYAASEYRNTESLISSIHATATWFGSTVDKRVMLIAGAGLPRNPGYDIFLYINDLKQSVEVNGPNVLIESARRTSPLTDARQYDVRPHLEQLRDSMIARGIAIYTLNPGRSEDFGSSVETARGGMLSGGNSFERMTNANSGFETIAAPSGGIAFAGMPPDKALTHVTRDLTSYYSLAHESDGDATVRAKGGHRVRATRTAGPVPPDARMREAVLTHLMSAPATNELGIALTAEPSREAGTDRIVPLRVLIPISKLKIDPAGKEVHGGFTVYLTTTNGHGASTPVVKRTHEIRWPAEAMSLGQGKNMTYAIDVIMLNGFQSISVGVLDDKSEKTGFERISVK